MRMLQRLVYTSILGLPLTAQTRVHLEGSVRAEQTFRGEIGSGLFLALVPITSVDSTGFGWQIKVEPADGSDDFVRCVIGPIHGPTQADLLAWQFVTDANEELPASELKPLKTRRLQFVLNTADQKKACDELNVIAYGSPQTNKGGTRTIGTPGYVTPPLGNATLMIKTIKLSNLGYGNHARFDSVAFEAEFELPPGGPGTRAARGLTAAEAMISPASCRSPSTHQVNRVNALDRLCQDVCQPALAQFVMQGVAGSDGVVQHRYAMFHDSDPLPARDIRPNDRSWRQGRRSYYWPETNDVELLAGFEFGGRAATEHR